MDSLPGYLEMINSTSTEKVKAAQKCLQNLLNIYSGMNDEPDNKPSKALCELYKKEIDNILSCLLDNITSKTITGLARDAIIQLITRNIHYTALNWAKRVIELRGLQKLIEVASQSEEYKYESSLDITSSTQTITGACLAKIYENIHCDSKETFKNVIIEFIGSKRSQLDVEPIVRITVAITTLTLSSLDIEYKILFKDALHDNILDDLIDMPEITKNVLLQKAVCECIVAVTNKYNEANKFLCESVPILENMYDQSKDDSIRVRAFVCLCKVSRFRDIRRNYTTFEPLADGLTKNMDKICRQFLIHPENEKGITKWAVAGLSYLSSIVKVKAELIEDQQAIHAIIEFAKTDDQSVIYGVEMLLVNLCNAYNDMEEHVPEKKIFDFEYYFFVGQKLNDNSFEKGRCVLAKAGVTTALVHLAKTASQKSKALIASVFNAICSQQELRETVVQQGGTEALLLLALDGTVKGKKHASQALVRLALTIHPEVTFPGQIIMEVVKPIINLLNPKSSKNENSEALTALCNIANVNDRMRKLIFDLGFEKFAEYITSFDNHNHHHNYHMLKLRSAQLLDNLALCRQVDIECSKQYSEVLSRARLIVREDKLNKITYKEMAMAETHGGQQNG